jgi:hypothetical protein
MQSDALPIDWIFRPTRWRPARSLPGWLRHWAARQLERRQAPRSRVDDLVAHYWDATAAYTHVVRDVSTGGAFIWADFKWPLGTIVALTLELEGHPAALLLQTKVVRCTSDGLGVQFLCFSKPRTKTWQIL